MDCRQLSPCPCGLAIRAPKEGRGGSSGARWSGGRFVRFRMVEVGPGRDGSDTPTSPVSTRISVPDRAICARGDPSCGRAENLTVAKTCMGNRRNRGRRDPPRNHALDGVAARDPTVRIPATAAGTHVDRRLQPSSPVLRTQWSFLGSHGRHPANWLWPHLGRVRPYLSAALRSPTGAAIGHPDALWQ
jgi:hypothetical protein